MNMLLTAVLVCLALSATAEPNKQTLQQLMEARLSEIHHEMREEIKQLKLENLKQRESYQEQLDAAVNNQLQMEKQLRATLGYLSTDLGVRMDQVEDNVAGLKQGLVNTQEQQRHLKTRTLGVDNQLEEVQDNLMQVRGLIADINVVERVAEVDAGAASGERYSFLVDLSYRKWDLPDPFDIVFDRVLYDRNSSYDSSTGEYTVPVDGVYLFTASVQLQPVEDEAVLWLRVDGSNIATTQSSQNSFSTVSVTSQLQLLAGQKVKIRVYLTSAVFGHNAHRFTWFSGHLVQL